MANVIQALVRFGLLLGGRAKAAATELAQRLAWATGARHGIVTLGLMALEGAIVTYGSCRMAVALPGIGKMAPCLTGNSEIRLRYRPAGNMKRAFRALDACEGAAINRENVG